jgi:hypothetical protein
MLQRSTIWSILRRHVPKQQWVSIGEIFMIVESHWTMDSEDMELNARHIPRWKRNVRSELHSMKKRGRIQGRPKH